MVFIDYNDYYEKGIIYTITMIVLLLLLHYYYYYMLNLRFVRPNKFICCSNTLKWTAVDLKLTNSKLGGKYFKESFVILEHLNKFKYSNDDKFSNDRIDSSDMLHWVKSRYRNPKKFRRFTQDDMEVLPIFRKSKLFRWDSKKVIPSSLISWHAWRFRCWMVNGNVFNPSLVILLHESTFKWVSNGGSPIIPSSVIW